MQIPYFSHRPTAAWMAVSALAVVLALAACGKAASTSAPAAAPAILVTDAGGYKLVP